MNPSDLTPEIIATKIFKWNKETRKIASGAIIEIWIGPTQKEAGLQLSSTGNISGLPTFLEPEWTGPLLAKAAEVSKYYMLRFRKNGLYEFALWHKRKRNKKCVSEGFDGRHKELNYAIADAILEASA
jgi:hypothetical protein